MPRRKSRFHLAQLRVELGDLVANFFHLRDERLALRCVLHLTNILAHAIAFRLQALALGQQRAPLGISGDKRINRRGRVELLHLRAHEVGVLADQFGVYHRLLLLGNEQLMINVNAR